ASGRNGRGGHASLEPRQLVLLDRAWIRIEVLDEAWRGIGVQMLENRAIADVDLLALEYGRDRHDDGELLQVSAEVVGHREHGLVVATDEHDLRRLVEELRVRLRDVEAAEGERRVGWEQREEQRRDARCEALHGVLRSCSCRWGGRPDGPRRNGGRAAAGRSVGPGAKRARATTTDRPSGTA